MPRWLIPSNIYIQFTIFNTYFSTKLSFTNQRYHLHVLEKCLYVLKRSQIYYIFSAVDSSPFSSFTWQRNKLYILVVYHRIGEFLSLKFFLNKFYFVLFFYHFFICRHHKKIRLVILSKSYLYKFFFWSFFLLKLTFNKTI